VLIKGFFGCRTSARKRALLERTWVNRKSAIGADRYALYILVHELKMTPADNKGTGAKRKRELDSLLLLYTCGARLNACQDGTKTELCPFCAPRKKSYKGFMDERSLASLTCLIGESGCDRCSVDDIHHTTACNLKQMKQKLITLAYVYMC
jgi:hypothetical protein